MTFLLVQVLNALAFSLMLFFASAGLSISFGLLNMANLAHGSFYMLGGYLALTVLALTHSYLVALIVVPAVLGVAGALLEMAFLRRLYRRDHLDQLLLTLGFAYLIWDLSNFACGGASYILPTPAALDHSVDIGGLSYPVYRIVVLGVGIVVAAALLWAESRTRVGALIRAGVSDPQMLRAMGVNVTALFTCAFAFGTALAGLAGIIGGPIIGLYRDVDFDILMLAIIVVVVGGLGSLRGTLLSCVLIGLVDSLGRAYFPDFALVTIFLIMGVVLIVRPAGLFGVDRGLAAA